MTDRKGGVQVTPHQLKAARERLGLTQTTMAEALGVVRESVNRWERGAVAIPKSIALAVKFLLKEGK
jgi:DNA-binding XRE family transcriptional regulator